MRSQKSAIDDLIGLFDDPRYARLALENREAYRGGAPFPHAVFDDFLTDDLARSLEASFPDADGENWIVSDNANASKLYQFDETKLPTPLRAVLREFNSQQFLLFLETLTGIESLLPDPYFIGGGTHLVRPGGYLKVHADFNWHHKLLAHRRVNVLLYLNSEWDPVWGGALELWDREVRNPVRKIDPLLGRLVVFTTTEHSNHGHPRPLRSPAAVDRKALNLYYYTTYQHAGELAEPHFTLYKTENSPFAQALRKNYDNSAKS